jgi:hypothetical protein
MVIFIRQSYKVLANEFMAIVFVWSDELLACKNWIYMIKHHSLY